MKNRPIILHKSEKYYTIRKGLTRLKIKIRPVLHLLRETLDGVLHTLDVIVENMRKRYEAARCESSEGYMVLHVTIRIK